MPATVIDSLIVTLGLNSKSLKAGAPAATKQIEGIEKAGDQATESVNSLGKALGSFLALIGGTAAIKHFVEDMIDSNAQLERFAKNIGLSVSTVSAWGNAVEEFGGSAKSLQGTMDMLSKSQTELQLTGQTALIPYLSALGVSLADVAGNAKPVDEILLDLSDRFSTMNRTQANNMGRMMGIDQDTLNLLLQGRKEVELITKRQKEQNAVTKSQAEESVKLQRTIIQLKQSFAAFGRDLLQSATPMLEKLLSLFTDLGNWVRTNGEFVKDFLTVLAVGLGALAIAALPLTGTVGIITALGSAIALLWQDYQTWKRGGDSLIDWEKWKPGIDLATAAIDFLITKLQQVLSLTQSVAKFGWNQLKFGGNNPAVANNEVGNIINKSRAIVGLGPKPYAANATNGPETVTADRARKYFQDRGMSPAEAAGLAAQIAAESKGRTNAVGDNGAAYGILQWHSDRQKKFADFAGHDIRQSTADEQLAFIVHELTRGSEQSAGRVLSKQTNAFDAGSLASRLYVRPADVSGEANRRGAAAQMLMGIKGASSMLAGAGASPMSGKGAVDNSVKTDIGEIKVYTNATDADGIARDMGGAMNSLFTSQANTGMTE